MKKKLILSLTCLAALSASAVLAMPDKVAKPAAANAAQPTEVLSGKVLETMNSGGYTYVNLQKKNGEKIWVAAPETSVKAGSQVSFKGGMEMVNFESKSLKRKFDKIVFADGLASGAAAATAAKADAPKDAAGSPGSKGAASEKDTKISVPKATGPNATTVQGAFANSAKLNKKKVVIRGKVVKVSARIMDRNWVHIQDGTGSQAKGNHNLVCTSKEMVNVGDIVTVSGILAKDRDFGGGYKYSAIVEDATFKK